MSAGVHVASCSNVPLFLLPEVDVFVGLSLLDEIFGGLGGSSLFSSDLFAESLFLLWMLRNKKSFRCFLICACVQPGVSFEIAPKAVSSSEMLL